MIKDLLIGSIYFTKEKESLKKVVWISIKYIWSIVISLILIIAGAIGIKNTFFVAPVENFYFSLVLIVLGLCIFLALLLFSSVRKYKSTDQLWSWQLGLFLFIFLPIAFFALRFLFYHIYYTFT